MLVSGYRDEKSAFGEVLLPLIQGGAMMPVMQINGQNPNLQPEDARTWSAGLDYEPGALPGTRLSLSYFAIDHEGRLDVPAFSSDADLVLEREAQFDSLIDRDPTLEGLQLAASQAQMAFFSDRSGRAWDRSLDTLLDVFPDLVVFDNGLSNVAVEYVRGVDLTLQWDSSSVVDSGWLQGIVTSLSIKNLLDETPPRISGSRSFIAYDGANANPFGRYVSVQVRKAW